MIVREIVANPVWVMSTFDWWNDFDDTLSWLQHNHPELVSDFKRRHEGWLQRRHDRAQKHETPASVN